MEQIETIMFKLKLFFAWYDLWIGCYYDRKARFLYICLIPTICIRISRNYQSQRYLKKHGKQCAL